MVDCGWWLAERKPRIAPAINHQLQAGSPKSIEITLTPKDVPIHYGAAVGKATHLLTCDVANFGEVMRRPYRHLNVVTPAVLARELKKLGII